MFFLLDIWLLLCYIDTSDRRWYVAQCATFILGFLVLELNVVYPALATVVALCCAPRILPSHRWNLLKPRWNLRCAVGKLL